MKNYKRGILLGLMAVTILGTAFAQEVTENTLSQDVEALQADNALAKKLKISGYVQSQFQKADTAGISSYAGGDFSSGVDSRMTVRRGRIKVAYDNQNAQAVMQFDITEKGLGIKDAFVTVLEPWLNTFSLTGGVFDRPFGNEISYSSNKRESPERSRIFQTLFPGERDLGARLTIQAPKTSTWNFLKLDLGLMDGNGTNVETDSYKDFIGHLYATKTSRDENLTWGLGTSYYNGGYAVATDKSYKMTSINGVEAFKEEAIRKGDRTQRQYFGVDGQISYDWVLGITQVRAEYLTGTQPGTSSKSASLTAAADKDVYNRPFNGYYAYFIQDILSSPWQAVLKYDVYDPNTAVKGNEIGQSVNGGIPTGAADIKYSTLGLGLNYRWSANVKLTAYYDLVKNETTALLPAASTLSDLSHDRKDNVFTFRIQYKF